MEKTIQFCQEVKGEARKFTDFDMFFEHITSKHKNQKVLHSVDFTRLIQVAAVEADLA